MIGQPLRAAKRLVTLPPSNKAPYGERGTRDMFEDKQGRMWYGAQPYFKVGYVRIRSEAEKAAALGR